MAGTQILVLDTVIVWVILQAAIDNISICYVFWVFKRIHIHAFWNIPIVVRMNYLTSAAVLYQILLLPLDPISTVAA
jgi:hypothetical protein